MIKKLFILLCCLIFIVGIADANAFSSFSAYGDAWKATNDTYTIIKYNATGIHNWIATGNATTVGITICGGGGQGGGSTTGESGQAGGAAGACFIVDNIAVSGNTNATVGYGGYTSGSGLTTGQSGENSQFGNSYIATGGPGGAGKINGISSANASGSGAGNNGYTGGTGGTYGHNGGNGGAASAYAAGGGGGIATAGASATATSGGSGGDGRAYPDRTGTTQPLGAGGAGGADSGTQGLGGSSSTGGNGDVGAGTSGTVGMNETGSGGGGRDGTQGTVAGRRGGTGVIYIIYSTSPLPVASFTPSGTTTGVDVVSVQFTDTTTNSPNTWNWSYQGIKNGNVTKTIFSQSQNPLVSFYGANNYSITMNATNANGGNDTTQTTWINVSASPSLPVPSFTSNVTSGTAPTAVSFTDTSVLNPTGWIWSFTNATPGNNTLTQFSVLQNPMQVFGGGNWNIFLNVTNSSGYNTTTNNYWINISAPGTPPVASFTYTPSSGTSPLSVSFTDTSTGAPTSRNWTFRNATGNNTPISFSTVQNPVQVFGIGNYSIALNATNAIGSNISAQASWVNVSAPIIPLVSSFTVNTTSGNANLPVLFTDTTTGSPITWNYTFRNVTGNNTPIVFSQVQNPIRVFGIGNYAISLNTTNSNGYNISSQTTWINVTNSSSIGGFNRQDLVMYPQYLLTLNIVDTSGNPIPDAMVLDSNGLNTTVPFGIYTQTYGYSIVVFYVMATGYVPASASYVIDSNMTETITLTKASVTPSQNANVIFSPRSVAIQILDANYNPIVGDPVYLNAHASSLPGGLTGAVEYFKTTYGVAESTAQSMLAANTSYYGTTDDYGFVAVQVADIIQYQVVTHDTTGANTTRLFWPSGPYYQIVTGTAAVSGIAAQGRTQAAINMNSTFNTTFWEPNSTYSCMGINVYDSTGQTSNVYAWWKLVDNGTIWWTNSTAIGGYGPINSSMCVLHVPYQQWKWGGITG